MERQIDPQTDYVSWSAIFIGAFIATAISVVLLQFGAAVGLLSGVEVSEDGSGKWSAVLAGLWLLVVALIGAGAGGYIAGRLRPRMTGAPEEEAEFRDGIHGVAVWAVALVFISAGVLLAGAISGAIAAAVSDGGNAASTETSARTVALIANSGVILAFMTGASSVLAAAVSWFAATAGGEDRDNNVPNVGLSSSVMRRKGSVATND